MRWFLAALLFLAACTDNLRIPSDVIERPRMEKIIWEMMQADRFANTFITAKKDTLGRNKAETLRVYDKVLNYNNITRGDFFHSYNFYLGRPDLLKVMYDSISARADRQRASLFPRKGIDSVRWKLDSTHNVRKRDSLRSHMDSLQSRGFTKALARRMDSLRQVHRRDSIKLHSDSLRKSKLHRAELKRSDSLLNANRIRPRDNSDSLSGPANRRRDSLRRSFLRHRDSLLKPPPSPQSPGR